MPKVSPSVLIIRLDGIGDALALTLLLAAFRRERIPVDAVLRPQNAAAFSSRALRKAIVAGFALRSSARDDLAAIERLGGDLGSNGYSHVLVATEDPAGYRLAGAIDAPVRVGFTHAWGKPLKALWTRRFLTETVERTAGLDRRAPHECEVLFRLGATLAIAQAPPRDAAELKPLVIEHEPPAGGRVAVQITEKWERLGIPIEDVVALVARLATGKIPHLLSARAHEAYGRRIVAASGIAVEYFDELEPWKNAIAAADALVAPDSGAVHVAGMTGTPVVAVFAPQRGYALQVARWSPWAAPHRIVKAVGDWPIAAAEALAQLSSA